MTTVAELLAAKPPALYSVEPDEPVLEAIKKMAEHGIGALLVMQGEKLAGIVSERDYARKVILLGRSSSDTPVSQIMTASVIT
ncbi:MAG TPA: CBS domain-containing protein, partial [Steroidobacteraceae bacterium]|nr:CBS domain-containing protein [Steroidobacteraceae bacterium]